MGCDPAAALLGTDEAVIRVPAVPPVVISISLNLRRSLVAGAADDGVGDEVAAFGSEEAAVGCGAVFGDVLEQQAAEGR